MSPIDTLAADAVPYSPAGFRQLGVLPVPSSATLARWRLRGLRDCRPETFLRGGRRYITPNAIAEFFAAVTRAADGSRHAISSQPTSDDIDRELDRECL